MFHSRFIIEYEKRFEFSKVLIAINEDLQKEFDHSISYIQLVLKSLMPDADRKSSDGMEQVLLLLSIVLVSNSW